MRYLIDDEVDAVIRESNVALFGTDDYDALMEVWSDAARAASAAARRAKASGKDWRKAARKEYVPRANWRAEGERQSGYQFKQQADEARRDVGKTMWSSSYEQYEKPGDKRPKAASGEWSSDAAKLRYAERYEKGATQAHGRAKVWSGAANRAVQKQRQATRQSKLAKVKGVGTPMATTTLKGKYGTPKFAKPKGVRGPRRFTYA